MKQTIPTGFIFLLFSFLFLSCSLPNRRLFRKPVETGYISPLRYNQWKLVWQDEFDGLRIDTTKWTQEVNDWGGGNEELQYYTARPENAFVEDGVLAIVAQKEPYQTRGFTSARLNSHYKGDWKYGRFDIRAKMPKGWGLWSAIWMLPTDNEYGAWPAGGEIDIAEVLGREPTELYGSVHFGSRTPEKRRSIEGKKRLLLRDFSQQFHVFSIEWEPYEIRWYLDNQLYHTAKITRPLDERYHLLLNLAIGGQWPGHPKVNTEFPSYFYVDYVRVFERDVKQTLIKTRVTSQSGN